MTITRFLSMQVAGLALLATMAQGAAADGPEWPLETTFLTRTVFVEGRLWILDGGTLSSIAEGEGNRAREPLTDQVLDLCRSEGHAVILTSAKSGGIWAVQQHGAGGWSQRHTIRAKDDTAVAMDCAPDGITLLTTRRLVTLNGIKQRAIALSATLGGGTVSAIYVTADDFFIGFNNGEWGGGLRSIDRRHGKVTVIERNTVGPCSGPLATGCDPVNSIIADPWRPGCIAAAIGLEHIEPHGRIVEVCGNDVRRLYAAPASPGSPPDPQNQEPSPSVAFYWLTSDGNKLWAAAQKNALYEIDSSGHGRLLPLPTFTDIEDIGVDFTRPQFVLLRMTPQRRDWVAGPVLTLVPR